MFKLDTIQVKYASGLWINDNVDSFVNFTDVLEDIKFITKKDWTAPAGTLGEFARIRFNFVPLQIEKVDGVPSPIGNLHCVVHLLRRLTENGTVEEKFMFNKEELMRDEENPCYYPYSLLYYNKLLDLVREITHNKVEPYDPSWEKACNIKKNFF
jgi:hypothetical protein